MSSSTTAPVQGSELEEDKVLSNDISTEEGVDQDAGTEGIDDPGPGDDEAASSAQPSRPRRKRTSKKTSPEKPAAELSEEELYNEMIGAFQVKLCDLAERSENVAWEHAQVAYGAIQELERKFDMPRERFYEDLAAGHPWAAKTIKKSILTCEKLSEIKMPQVFQDPHTGFTQAGDIVFAAKLSEDARADLLRKVYKHDKKHPAERYTVQQVRGMIKDLCPPEETQRQWMRGTDLWTFSDHDPRFGTAGFEGRIPGQVVQNFIHRFSNGVARVLVVGCGGGTALDVCAEMKKEVSDYRGVDILLSPSVLENHPDNVTELDCTRSPEYWDTVCPEDWADMVLVTMPNFNFEVKARTQEPTDLGNVKVQDEYIRLMSQVIRGAASRLNTHGVMGVVTRSTSDFGSDPVVNIDHFVTRHVQEMLTFFLAKIAFAIKKERPKGADENASHVVPEVQYLNVYRKI